MKSSVKHNRRIPRRVSKLRAARANALQTSDVSLAESTEQLSVATSDQRRTPRPLDVSPASVGVPSPQQPSIDSHQEPATSELAQDSVRCADGPFPHAEAERLNARVLLSAPDSPPPRFSLEAHTDPRRLATRLLDLQLWCLGKDIEFPQGNLLLRFGMEKLSPPAGWKAVSLYRQSLSSGVSVLLRGFGLFMACERQGTLYLPRENFRMIHWPAPLPTRLPWRTEDLPPFPPLQPDLLPAANEPGLHLTRRLLHWLADYEIWIQQTVGITYREQTCQAWHKAQHIPLPAHTFPHAWRALGDALLQL